MTHPLLDPEVVREIETAASAHAGQAWRLDTWTDLGDRSSHPALILRDGSRGVFAKLIAGEEAPTRATSELGGLGAIANAGVAVPVPIDPGFAERRELWRVAAYPGVLTVEPTSEFGHVFRGRLSTALDRYL